MNNSDIFISKAILIHGNKYNYSNVDYVNAHTKVCIICPKHGEFWQNPNNHLNGQGCPHCGGTKKYTNDSIIKKFKDKNGDKYDYSKVKYINSKTKVCIICHKHGEFWIKPNDHLNGHGCPNCGGTKKLTNEEVIKRFKRVHGEKYNYSEVEYTSMNSKVSINCLKHGKFLQTPHDHLKGCGCPLCNESKLEKEINDFLVTKNIKFQKQKKFEWLNRQSLDFYLTEYNIAIECQGIQHFKEREFFENVAIIQERDKLKKQLCEEHGIKILYYSDFNIDFPYHVFTNKEELLKEITR